MMGAEVVLTALKGAVVAALGAFVPLTMAMLHSRQGGPLAPPRKKCIPCDFTFNYIP